MYRDYVLLQKVLRFMKDVKILLKLQLLKWMRYKGILYYEETDFQYVIAGDVTA